MGYLDYIYQCKGCLSCVQNCTKGILTRVVNPEYKRLGDAYFTPDILLTTWFQAETGRIPVSGGGYGGPFSGKGFDSIWTDMSKIVRPTRDGIHGREGFVPTVLGEVKPSSADAVALVCGPPIMLKFTIKPLLDLGFAPEAIFTSLERRMSCGIGKCGRCDIGGKYVCKDGPVFSFKQLQELTGGQF